MVKALGRPQKAKPPVLALGTSTFDWSRPYLMGVVNVTPDSFSDGGQFDSAAAACEHALFLADSGADILDIGGESTRPNAPAVSVDEELARVLPVIEGLRARTPVAISIDTTKASVAQAAVAAGATIINDVSGGLFDPAMLPLVARCEAAFVCGHLRGESLGEAHAAKSPSFDEIIQELGARLADLGDEARARCIVDPCIGFGKSLEVNLECLARAGEMAEALGCATLVGPSRKRFLGEVTGRSVGDRDPATFGACLASVLSGAHILRVHEVAGMHSALAGFRAVSERGGRA